MACVAWQQSRQQCRQRRPLDVMWLSVFLVLHSMTADSLISGARVVKPQRAQHVYGSKRIAKALLISY